ncbi:MAG TPA: thioredoxin [Spirillospora sp.]|nr:thioredoxin [Spirillospora sp.]
MAGKTFEATTENFEKEVLGSDTPVLVDFWAVWCEPCKMIAPIVEQLANEYDGKLRVAKLDADAHQEIVFNYGIMGIPTLILFKDGEAVGRVTGYKPKDKIVAELKLAEAVS